MINPETGWVSRWVVAMHDPLVDTDARREIDEGLKELVAAHPHWFAAWFSGHLSDIVSSLDPEDPWRRLHVEEGTAVHANGRRFGSPEDSEDLARPSVPDLRSDLGLAALAPGLPDESAVLIALAANGWDPVLAWCEKNLVKEPVLGQKDAAGFFKIATAALRWAMHRRRLYMGPEDPFIPVNGIAWIGRAHKVTAGTPWDEARAARILAESSVEPGTYMQLI